MAAEGLAPLRINPDLLGQPRPPVDADAFRPEPAAAEPAPPQSQVLSAPALPASVPHEKIKQAKKVRASKSDVVATNSSEASPRKQHKKSAKSPEQAAAIANASKDAAQPVVTEKPNAISAAPSQEMPALKAATNTVREPSSESTRLTTSNFESTPKTSQVEPIALAVPIVVRESGLHEGGLRDGEGLIGRLDRSALVDEPVQSVSLLPATEVLETPEMPYQEREIFPTLSLRKASLMQLDPAEQSKVPDAPVFVMAQRMDGRTDDVVHLEGQVELRRQGISINADSLNYDQVANEVSANGHVRLQRGRDVLSGPELFLRMDTSEGFMNNAEYSLERTPKRRDRPLPRGSNTGHGEADRIELDGENRYRLRNATFSTCEPGNKDWYVQSGDIDLDFDRDLGVARDTRIVFKDVPILYSPWLDFSLNNNRKTGLLPPTIGSTSRTGVDTYIPWYWNIAPNMDATIAPRVMSRRGVQLNSEFRYLNTAYEGTLRGEYLGRDQVTGQQRSAYQISHRQHFAPGFEGTLNLNGASDKDYYTDLGTRLTTTSQSYLLREGRLTYNPYGWWTASALVQKYQVLQSTSLPYAKLPELSLNAYQPDGRWGSTWSLNANYAAFSHPTLVEANRLVLNPQFALPIQNSAAYITPKLGVHYTRYDLTRQAAGVPGQITRTVPMFSIDSGVVFERDTEFGGKMWSQTLEPRLFYNYVPYRNQNNIPLFDTAAADFNFSQIFSDNLYVGSDRIADANQVTGALTTRFIDPASGEETFRAAVGSRYYLADQRVTLLPTDVPRTRHLSDYLAAVSGRVWTNTWLDSAVQYDSDQNHLQRFKVGVRYNPGMLKVANVAYRFQRNALREIDISGQWPIAAGWYGVGRYNYSLQDRRIVESLGGVEYDAGCWALRFVVQRLATGISGDVNNGTPAFNTSFFVQLELNGLARIGSNPLETLKRTVPGYGIINQSTSDPVFGGTQQQY